MPQSSRYTDIDDNNDKVTYLKPSQWNGSDYKGAHYGVAHRPLAVGAKVTLDFVGEFLYS